MNNKKNKNLIALAMLTAIIFVLSFTPLGFIPIGPINATILHIPVIIGACLLGPKNGGILGFAFGLASFIKHSFVAPVPTSFVFTPFYNGGNFYSIIICFIPRILIGIFAGFLFKIIYNSKKFRNTAGIAAGICGSLTNTVFVLGLIAIFFGGSYSTLQGKTMAAIIITTLTTNGVMEIIISALVIPVVVWPLKKIYGLDDRK